MDLDDLITISTPEGVELRLALAGLGSRFIAGVVDLAIQGILILILALITGAIAHSGSASIAAFVIGTFAIEFFYPVMFEVLAAGQTPGKRFSHLRVVRDSGAPVDLPASAIRNLMRLLDGPPLLYLPTVISIAITRRNQRPGDLAAGTIVIRERPAGAPAASAPPPRPIEAGREGWDVSAVTLDETSAVRRFLERRESLDDGARQALALRLAEGLKPKVTGAAGDLEPERFLEALERVKRER